MGKIELLLFVNLRCMCRPIFFLIVFFFRLFFVSVVALALSSLSPSSPLLPLALPSSVCRPQHASVDRRVPDGGRCHVDAGSHPKRCEIGAATKNPRIAPVTDADVTVKDSGQVQRREALSEPCTWRKDAFPDELELRDVAARPGTWRRKCCIFAATEQRAHHAKKTN